MTRHPQAPAAQAAQIKQDLRDAFYVDSADWKEKIAKQAQAAIKIIASQLTRRAPDQH